ncbi:MAG: M36 family metallopeptidase [Bacteroidota bacterium]
MQTALRHYLLWTILFGCQLALAQDEGLNIANATLQELAVEKNYTLTDVQAPIVSDDYTSNGIRHIYYQQTIDQIGIYGTSGAVHLKDGEVIASSLNFLPQIEKRDIRNEFQIQALEAVARLALDQNYPLSQTEVIILNANDAAPEKNTTIKADGISNRTIPMKLVYFVNPQEEIQLAWSLFIDEKEDAQYKNFLVDATTGAVLLEDNLTISCNFDHGHDHSQAHHHHHPPKNTFHRPIPSLDETVLNGDSTYNVIPFNIESPHFGNRSLLQNPWQDTLASPNGWHHVSGVNSEYTFGNNANAYSDRDNTNDPTGGDAARAFGGPNLVFDHPWTPTGTQTDYTDAAITNLFYITNVAHDIFYNYGFDEPSGNFQEENFGRGGQESDNVLAEAQDASSACNANITTPGDGANPRMQMFLCQGRDGDFDNAVIFHEYGHGVSIRLTGGPQAVACLGNVEQMGEGWSDFFGMLLTMKPTDVATTPRTIGTWLNNQPANGSGFRLYPYTTDMTVNPMTYQTIESIPGSRAHGVGSVWATMLWDLNWALIDQYGRDADLYHGTGGNNIALKLVVEALKLQPCSPGFVDARDAILAADLVFYGGVNRCLIWEVFARRGLGYSASQGSSNSRSDGIEGYDMPPECTIELKHKVDRPTANTGERLTYELTAFNHLDALATNIIITDTLPDNVQFYSASNGGTLNSNVVQWPAMDLAPGDSTILELKVTINDTIDFDPDFIDSLEMGPDQWKVVQASATHTWQYQSQYYYSPSNAFFITNADSTTETHLVLLEALALTDSSELSFNHYFDLEDRYDFGLVDISIDGGKSWINLENDFTQNGYNNYTQFGHYAFSRRSNEITPNVEGYITSKADLSRFAGEVALIRFRLLTDINTAAFGWIVDDIGISNTNYALPSFSNIRNGEYDFDTQVQTPTIVSRSIVNHTVETQADTLITFQNAFTKVVDVQANDVDSDPLDTLTTSIITFGKNGVTTLINQDSVSYSPNLDFVGKDTIIYQVCDLANACEIDTLFVFVYPVNRPPTTASDTLIVNENSTNNLVDVQANDSDPDQPLDSLITEIVLPATNGTAQIIDEESIDYTPNPNFFGLDTLIYQVCDTATSCATDTLFITVLEENDVPITASDKVTVNKNSQDVPIDVQANDNDPNGAGDTLTTFIVENAVHGNATVLNGDSLLYTPSTDYVGGDTIVYQVCDTSNLCTSDTVYITVDDVLLCDGNDLVENGNTMNGGNYVAANSIESSGVIENPDTVSFTAGATITLLPGFHAQAGSNFTAQISPCTPANAAQEGEPNLAKEMELKAFRQQNEFAKNSLEVRPNPFTTTAVIDYELGEASTIWLGLHDMTGKVLHVLVPRQSQIAGQHQQTLTDVDVPAGAYWISLRTEKEVLTKKVIVLE